MTLSTIRSLLSATAFASSLLPLTVKLLPLIVTLGQLIVAFKKGPRTPTTMYAFETALARQLREVGRVTMEGLNGMRQALGYLAQVAPVRLVWTDRMFGGKFRGRQPESLSLQEWTQIREYLSGKAEGWSLA